MTPAAKLIRQFRARHGLTQEEVAQALGIGRRTLQGWESGEHEPAPFLFSDLFRTFNVEPRGEG